MKRSFEILLAILSISLLFSSCSDDFGNQPGETNLTASFDTTAKRSCGLSEYRELLESDPVLRQEHEERMDKFEKYAATTALERTLCSNPTKLPVAVHYQNISSPNASCLISLAQTQVTILNQDYQGTNSDISTWNTQASSHFPGVSNGETCMEFVIADQNHPSGFGLSNGDLAVTINETSGDQINAFSGYINIIVRPNTGLLGYSPLGGAGNGDGVVVDAAAFGAGSGCGQVTPQSPFNLGRTLTHELGHYLNLDHIWGNGCGVDDLVADTPNQKNEHYDCPNFGITSCSSKDMFMNYMDYVNDACMYMFSAGQSTRMENWMNSNLTNVINKGNSVLSGGSGGGGGDDDDDDTTCASPTDGSASEITANSARISWSPVTGANRYRVSYKKPGGSWIHKTLVNSTSVVLMNLDANTTYTYRLRSRCTGFGWQPYAPSKTFTTTAGGGGGGGDDAIVKFRIKLDDYGSETTWELIDEGTGNVINEGGPYQDGNSGQLIKRTWTLEEGEYTVYIDDAYGDGICCNYGNGYVRIRDIDNTLVAESDGNFGFYDYLTFIVDDGEVYFNGKDMDEPSATLAPKPQFAGN